MIPIILANKLQQESIDNKKEKYIIITYNIIMKIMNREENKKSDWFIEEFWPIEIAESKYPKFLFYLKKKNIDYKHKQT